MRECIAIASSGESAGGTSPTRGEGKSILKGILSGRGGCGLSSSLVSLKCVALRAIVKVREEIFVPHVVVQLVATQSIRSDMNVATQRLLAGR
jgi:hypothetical protein